MKKVYGSMKFFSGVFFVESVFLYVWIEKRGLVSLWHDFGTLVFLVFSLLITWFFSSTSTWAYGEEGIEVYDSFGKCVKKYNWGDISSIVRSSSPRGSMVWPVIEMKDGQKIIIWYFTTRNYSKVLTDVVEYVQNKNKEAFVEAWVLKQVEKYL